MLPSQIILSAIIGFIIYKTIVSYGKGKLARGFFLLWISLWLVILLFIFNTELLTAIARRLQIGRGVDLAIYISIISLFYLIYKLFLKLNEIDYKITKLVRDEALKTSRKSRKSTF